METLQYYAKGVTKVTSSIGLGDTIAKITKRTGIKAVVDKASELIDIDCGCDKRQNNLNKRFPYKK